MSNEPKIIERAAQPYAAIKATVTMAEIKGTTDKLFPHLFGWLGGRGIAPASAPFFKYNVIDMERGLEIEWGAPTGTHVDGDKHVLTGTLPAGRYVSVFHKGPYD